MTRALQRAGRWPAICTCGMATALACFAGCASVPYAFPHVDRVGPLELGEHAPATTVVRADYTAPGDARWDRTASTYTIATVPQENGMVPRQERLCVARGVYLNQVKLSHDRRVDESLELRLYRRGFRTLQVTVGGAMAAWAPAATLNERELAIDSLLAPWVAGTMQIEDLPGPPTPPEADEIFRFTRTGAPTEREACAFAADEYDALLADVELSAESRARIAAKAAMLRGQPSETASIRGNEEQR